MPPATRMGMLLDLQLNERAYVVSVVATIFVPLTFVTGFFGMNFGWMIDHIDSPLAFWVLGIASRSRRRRCPGASGAAVPHGRRPGGAEPLRLAPRLRARRSPGLGRGGPDLGVDVPCGPPGDVSAQRREHGVEYFRVGVGDLGDHERDAGLEAPADLLERELRLALVGSRSPVPAEPLGGLREQGPFRTS